MEQTRLPLAIACFIIGTGLSGCNQAPDQLAVKFEKEKAAAQRPATPPVQEEINPKDMLYGKVYRGLSVYYDHMEAGRYRDARNVLIYKFGTSDIDIKRLIADAEIKDYKRIINDPKSTKAKRNEALLGLAAEYPNEAKQYEKQIETADKSLRQEREQVAERDHRKYVAEARKHGVRIGMSQDEVVMSSWGRPQSVNRTISSHGVSEQWVYGGRNYLYFENGVLTAIQN